MKFKILNQNYKLEKEYKAKGLELLYFIPWAMIAHAEQQAQHNHSQSLATLNSRGGLSTMEAVAVIKGVSWRTILNSMSETECIDWLRAESQKYETK